MKKPYEETEALKEIIKSLKGRKFKLECGHHVTFGHVFGNSITIYNDLNKLTIICSQCGY